jgi:hypothetical protein
MSTKARKAFVKRFGPLEKRNFKKVVPFNKFVAHHVLWIAWQAGAAWQKRQKPTK